MQITLLNSVPQSYPSPNRMLLGIRLGNAVASSHHLTILTCEILKNPLIMKNQTLKTHTD